MQSSAKNPKKFGTVVPLRPERVKVKSWGSLMDLVVGSEFLQPLYLSEGSKIRGRPHNLQPTNHYSRGEGGIFFAKFET